VIKIWDMIYEIAGMKYVQLDSILEELTREGKIQISGEIISLAVR